jgi:hypothetical protein
MLANRALLVLLVAACVALIPQDGAAQCAMCRTALENSAEGQAVAGSFRHGILLLLAAPYLIFATVGFVIFRAYRKKAAQRSRDLYIG